MPLHNIYGIDGIVVKILEYSLEVMGSIHQNIISLVYLLYGYNCITISLIHLCAYMPTNLQYYQTKINHMELVRPLRPHGLVGGTTQLVRVETIHWPFPCHQCHLMRHCTCVCHVTCTHVIF
jgi:hypothetical protein